MTKLSLLLLACSFIGASHSPAKPELMLQDEGAGTCALPAPGNINYDIIGTNFFKVSWPPVSGAAFYKVKAYEATTKKLVFSQVIPAKPSANVATVTGLEGGQSYFVKAVSICSNGMESANQ